MKSTRFNRQISFFGERGQEKIRSSCVAVVGVGGVGSHVVQQLAFLGVGSIVLIDPDRLETTNLNRLIGGRHDDPIPQTKKVDVAARLVGSIDPSIVLTTIDRSVVSNEAFDSLKRVDYIFGCVDNDGARLVLTELSSAFERPYFDLASEIIPGEPTIYGGRICSSFDENGCLVCLDELTVDEARRYLADTDALKDEESIYGVSRGVLDNSGPAVVSINGVVASLGVTEFLVCVTGLRQPKHLIKYRGSEAKVVVNIDSPSVDCYYCRGIRGRKEEVNVDRYLTP